MMTPAFMNRMSDFMQTTNNANSIEDTFSAPNNEAVILYSSGSWIKKIGARFLSIAQIIVSIVAVPLALLAMILIPMVTRFSHSKTTAYTYAERFSAMAIAHLFQIPESLMGAILPSILTQSVRKEMESITQSTPPNQLGQRLRQSPTT